jgi:Domain of unknown function (DUF5069)
MAPAAIFCASTMTIFASASSKAELTTKILEWCFHNGRQPNDGDLFVWNEFVSKLGWRDSFASVLEERKMKFGIADRTDILTIADLIDFDEGRFPEAAKTR